MKIRIVHDYNVSHATRIEDADTGEVIPGVQVVKFEHDIRDGWPTITLQIIKSAAVEIVANGELEDVTEVGDTFMRKRLVPPRPVAE